MLSKTAKPAANKTAKPAAKEEEKSPHLLPSEILHSIERLGDDALIIEHKKLRPNAQKTTWFGSVFFMKCDPKKPELPPVKTPLTILIVGCPVLAGCREKKPTDKSKSYSAMFNGKSTYMYNGVVEEYGRARIKVAEIFKRKMEHLVATGVVVPEDTGKKITTGVQTDVEDENATAVPGRSRPKIPIPSEDDYIIRVEIPFEKISGSQNYRPDSKPECVIRDIAQSRKDPTTGKRQYVVPPLVSVNGRREPLVYGNMPLFLLGGSEITGVERCDSWSRSPLALALTHKFPEIIVKRGTGTRDFSLDGKSALLDNEIDKMAEGAHTDESIEEAQREAALNGRTLDGNGATPSAISDEYAPPEYPDDPESQEGNPGDDLDIEAQAIVPVRPPPAAAKIPAKPAPKLITPQGKANSVPSKPVVTKNKKPAAPPPPPTDEDLDFDDE